MKRKIFSLLVALCVVLTFVVATSAVETTKYNVTVSVDGGVVKTSESDSGSDSTSIEVNEGSKLSDALSGLTLTSNGAKSDADPVSTNYYPANARDIATGSGNTFIIDASGNLWACGRNNYGQLGDKNSTSSYPGNITSLKKIEVSSGVKFKAVAAGDCHALLLDESGNVWTSGYYENGRLGRSYDKNANCFLFEKVTLTENDKPVTMTAIAAGFDFSLLLNSNGHVWACGENSGGQLGLGSSSDGQSTFTRITGDAANTTFIAISAGYGHSILLDENHNVWVAGDAASGRLGTGNESDVYTFKKLEITENDDQNTNTPVQFTAVSAGYDHSLLLDSNGSVWACGNNTYGELGIASKNGNSSNYYSFTKIDKQDVEFKQIVAKYNCSFLLDDTGGVWTCGQANNGNLGGNAGGATLTEMKDSAGKAFAQIKKIASPIIKDEAYLHTVFLDEYGCVWTVGDNYYGQLAGGVTSSAVVGRISCNSSDKATTDVRVEVVFDITPPVISGIKDGSTYTEAKPFAVTDDYGVASVTINKATIEGNDGSYTTNATGPQTIIATDNSGNTTTVSINKQTATIGFVKDNEISVTYDKEAVTAGTDDKDNIQYTYRGDSNVPTITATWYKKNESDEYEKLTGAPKDVGNI